MLAHRRRTFPAAAARAAGGGSRHRIAATRRTTPAQHNHRTRPSDGVFNQIGHILSLPLPVPDWSKPIILVLLLLSIGFGVRARINSRRARRLNRQRQRLIADMDSMQAALVPVIPSTVGTLNVSAAYQPADGLGSGGDFYDAFALDNGRVAIILGDVSGHGRAALAHAVRMRYTLRAYVEAGLDPRSALKLAGSVLGASQDELFTTVAVAAYDSAAATLTYAMAGHPPPLLMGGSCKPVSAGISPALGWGITTGRRQTTIPFSRGMSACFFTDGLTEARTGGGLLGRSRLAQMFVGLGRPGTASELLTSVREEAQEIRDDMAACMIEATTGNAAGDVSIEEFEIDLEQLTAGQGHRFLDACGATSERTAQAIVEGRHIALEHGGALFRVTRGNGDITVTVSPSTAVAPSDPRPLPGGASGYRAAQAVPTTSDLAVTAVAGV